MGAVVGRAELIDLTHPDRIGSDGYVYASGTLHGNPLGAAAGLATLKCLREPVFYASLARTNRASCHRDEGCSRGARDPGDR